MDAKTANQTVKRWLHEVANVRFQATTSAVPPIHLTETRRVKLMSPGRPPTSWTRFDAPSRWRAYRIGAAKLKKCRVASENNSVTVDDAFGPVRSAVEPAVHLSLLVKHRVELRDVMPVGSCHDERQRDTTAVHQQVPLAPPFFLDPSGYARQLLAPRAP